MSLDEFLYIRNAVGKDEQPIKVYKIRTMCLDANSRWALASANGLDNYGKVIDDPRVTNVGKFLRRYWLDELPQLYNLLKGDIGLVGIRPREEDKWDWCPQDHKERALKFKPGLFGIPYANAGIKKKFDLECSLGDEVKYLNEKEKAPFLTDMKYLGRIIYNIIFKNVRSS